MNARNIQIFHDAVLRLLRRGALKNLEKMLVKAHVVDVAQVVRALESERDRRDVFNLIPSLKRKADVLQVLDTEETIFLINELDHKKIVDIFSEMPSDTVADIIGKLPDDFSEDLLKLMDTKGSEVIEELLRYPEDTAGGIMATEFCALRKEITVKETIGKLQKELKLENIFYVYVVNKMEQLVGVLSLRKLFQVKPETAIEDIMISDVITVRTDTDQEEVAKLVARYNLLALPVVDESNKLVGIVTVDDVVDIIRDEATEDILKMGGVGDVEFRERSSIRSARFRLPWLFISLLGGVVAFKIMGKYQAILETSIILVFFIPLLMSMTGNVAIQASTIVVRGLSTGKIRMKEMGWILWKELKVGLLLGIVYGVIVGAFANLQYGHSFAYLGLAVGGSMLMSMMLATVIGATLPILFERFNIDPAFSAGPFVTTVADVLGILIYLSMATLLHGAF